MEEPRIYKWNKGLSRLVLGKGIYLGTKYFEFEIGDFNYFTIFIIKKWMVKRSLARIKKLEVKRDLARIKRWES